MKNPLEKFDVAVIGAGPAGMIAAGRAAELGAKVILLEKNKNLGKKLLITGKGRCNITQAEHETGEFVQKIGNKFLFSALAGFGPEDVIRFFEKKDLPTKVERGGRVFPVSDNSTDVINVLLKYIREHRVKILSDAEIVDFKIKKGNIASVELKTGEEICAKNFILATGGKSYPATGSTGDGYKWAERSGHTIVPTAPALVPLRTKESWVKNLQGLALKNVAINIFQEGKKRDSRFGEMIFTHFGISGPIVLDVSKKVGQLLTEGKVFIEIDLKPALDFPVLDKRLQRDQEKFSTKDFKNYLPELLPHKLIDLVISLSGIDAGKKVGFITKDERKKLVKLLKGMTLTVDRLMGYEHAIVTSGGVDTKEVDSKTMKSKKIKNLFFAGEILDLDGPTGGYNLQICWSTGYAAGTYASGKCSQSNSKVSYLSYEVST